MRVSDKVAEYLVENLAITHFFGVSGANIEDLFLAIDSKAKIILAKHEFNAATMCDGYFRTSQKMATLLTTSGGGALNIVPALAESYASRVPLLAIVGAAPLLLEGKGAFQDTSGKSDTLNLEKIYQEISCYCVKIVSKEQILDELTVAYAKALKMRRPSVIIVPKNIWSESLTSFKDEIKVDLNNHENTIEYPAFTVTKNTLLILGEELLRLKNNQEILALVKRLECTVLVTPEAKGLIKNVSVTGVMGEITENLNSIDNVLILGSRFSVMERFLLDSHFSKNRIPVFCVSQYESFYVETNVTNIKIENEIDFKIKVKSLLEQFNFKTNYSTVEDSKLLTLNLNETVSINKLGYLLNTTFDGLALNWVFDAGNVVCNAVKTLQVSEDSTFTIALGMGGMGYSFGAAIGATCSNDKYTIVLAGDGAFYMSGTEIHTAIQYNLPMLFIIANNNAHAMCVTREELFFNKKSSMNHFFKANISGGLKVMFPHFETFEINSYNDWYVYKSDFFRIINKRSPFAIVINVDLNEMPDFLPFKKL